MTFSTEAAVRLKFQWTDSTLVSADLIQAALADAHELIIRRLNPDRCPPDTVAPDAPVIIGETLLAGSLALRSLASKDAVDQKQLVLGGQRIDAGKRFTSLLTMAEQAALEAWDILDPYLVAVPAVSVASVTATIPLFE